MEKDNQQLQLHFISNTHWDREWRYSAQRTRHMLGYLMDMLFDIFEKEPNFKHFHLDSQTMPIQDYLEASPENKPLVEKYIKEGRLAVGPWFCLPDEFCIGGESIVRNLLLGHKQAKALSGVSKTGYSPFGWGQISQMPQIYQGFGIDMVSFYRGLNHYIAPKSEYIWEAPDGTRILASRLGKRPRYNVWYIIQRPVYWNQKDENNRVMSWGNGHGPFKFVDSNNYELDYQYAHPRFDYNKAEIPARVDQAVKEQDDDWTTPHRFWSDGHDSSCPDIREVDMIKDCNEAMGDKGQVFHSTIKGLQEGIKASINQDELNVLKGEMHHPFTKGSVSALFGWVLSARTPIKQDNFKTERDITYYAEPLASFASMQGASYPQNFIDLSYNYMLQNHGHDSIGACGRDIIYEDVIYRSRQSREISSCIIERAMMDIVGDINLSSWSSDEMALVVYNPAPFVRSDVMEAIIEIPLEWACEGFEIEDDLGEKVEVQIIEKISPNFSIVQSPNDTANTFPSAKYRIKVHYTNIPSMGYKTFKVKGIEAPKIAQPTTQLTSSYTMENEYISVKINGNGTLSIKEKSTGKSYNDLGYFRDCGEIGNPWQHESPQNDTVYTTLNENAKVTRLRDGALETSFLVEMVWSLPESRSKDEMRRSEHMKSYPIKNMVTLRKGQKWVEIETEVDNTVEDHYLQVSFPTGLAAINTHAQGQFDVVERAIKRPDYSLYDEIPMTEQPMNSFVDISDNDYGMAFLNEGLKAYEAHDDAEGTLSLTLLRGFPLRICVTQEMTDYSQVEKGSQCLGKQTFKYAVMPHSGNWEEANVWQMSEQFNLSLLAAQMGPTRHGKNPTSKSFIEFKEENIHVSALKRSEDGRAWVLRLFNPFTSDKQCTFRLNSGITYEAEALSPVARVKAEFELSKDNAADFSSAKLTNLEEIPSTELELDPKGWITVDIASKKIITIKIS